MNPTNLLAKSSSEGPRRTTKVSCSLNEAGVPAEELASYYKFDLAKNSFVAENLGVKGFYNRIFERAPIPILRFMGSAMYKHLG